MNIDICGNIIFIKDKFYAFGFKVKWINKYIIHIYYVKQKSYWIIKNINNF